MQKMGRKCEKISIFYSAIDFLVIRSRAICYPEGEKNMSDHVYIVSEWPPKENCEEELWNFFKELMAVTKKMKVVA